jgi:1-acyl-sn-glycerol-3-phosphate acyltransferase
MKPIGIPDTGAAQAEKLSPPADLPWVSLDTVRSCASRLKRIWYAGLHWLCARIYFEEITVLHPEHLSGTGPTLYVGLHRNGAVDGFVYQQVLPRAIFLISTQLLRSFFARLFFHGIAVARKGDEEDRGQNDGALRECLQLLRGGGELFVFPEGTSSLGPRHLPFKSGAARVALDALERGIPLRVVPLGIHYERAWAFRSKVEVVIGEPVATAFPADCSSLGRLKEMKRRITTALESVGTNFPSVEAQEDAQRIANAAAAWTPHSYFSSLKSLEAGVPEPLLSHWREFTPQLAAQRLPLYQGVPLYPSGPWMLSLVLLIALGPIVLAGALVNAAPLLLGWLAARRLADSQNVIALWRILVGVPVFAVWFGVVSLLLVLFAGWAWVPGYAFLTVAALKLLNRTKRLSVAVWNGLAHREFSPRVHEFYQSIRQTFAHS